MFILTVCLLTEYALVHFSLSGCCESTSFISSVIHPEPNCLLWGKTLLGPGSKQEHSWDMFKIGQTALHSKVDIYSSDFRNYGKVR